jgi:hypothetical protein
VTRRVIDHRPGPPVERIFDLIEAERTPGEVARILNAEGHLTRRGNRWTPRPVRQLIQNNAYAGTKGYPQLIDPDRWQSIQRRLKRQDPATVQRRKGGRRAADDYLLRGIAFCGRCGHSLYSRPYAAGRHYICGNVRQATGICDAPRIPAKYLERGVVEHLSNFFLDVEAWIAEKAQERGKVREDAERALAAERRELSGLARRVELVNSDYMKHLEAGNGDLAETALRTATTLEAKRDRQGEAIRERERALQDWPQESDADAALDFWNELQEFAAGRLREAESAAELRSALADLLHGVWIGTEQLFGREEIRAEFLLRDTPAVRAEELPKVVVIKADTRQLDLEDRTRHLASKPNVRPSYRSSP